MLNKCSLNQNFITQRLKNNYLCLLNASYISRVQIKVFQYGIFFKRCISFFKLSNFLSLVALGLCCCTWDFSDCGELRLLSSCAAWASHFRGISCCRTQILGYMGLAVVAQGLSCLQPVESSQIRDQTPVPCIGRWIFNHWTTREVLVLLFSGNRECEK